MMKSLWAFLGMAPRNTIGTRLLFYILFVSFFFTAAGTALQLYLDYRSDMNSLGDRIQQIEASYIKSLTKSTWDLDIEGIRLQLGGIIQLKDIVYLEVKSELGKSLAFTGSNPKEMAIFRQFPLRYEHLGEQITVGTLDVVASTQEVYSRLWKKFMIIVSTQAIKIFCMSAFILFIFQRLITRHLAKMAAYTEKIDLDHLDQPLKLDRQSSDRTDKDELDTVVTAFNEMRENLIEDIAKRKHAEEALKKSEEQYRMLLELMNDALIQIGRDGVILYANPKTFRLLGYSQSELIGRQLSDLFDDDNRKILAKQLEMRKSGFNSPYEISFLTKQQKNIQTIVYPQPIFSSDKNYLGSMALIVDVSERKQMEEMMIQAEKMISIGSLTAGMAHEINNPLGAIVQSAQNIERRINPAFKKNEAAAEACHVDLQDMHCYMEKRGILSNISTIRKAGSRAAEIILNMLKFSRISESKKSSRNLNELLDHALALVEADYDLKNQYDFKHIEIEKEYDVTLPNIICAETEIEQVFLNLLKNAAQAFADSSQNRKPRIRLKTSRHYELARVEISDNGQGMDESVRKRIFDPFFTTKNVGQGTGLGLFVSYMIITNNYKGQLSVESELNQGTRFVIQLPLENNS